MTAEQVGGIARTALAFLGGIAVAKGWIDNATMMQLTGAAVPLVVAVWSVRSKRKA